VTNNSTVDPIGLLPIGPVAARCVSLSLSRGYISIDSFGGRGTDLLPKRTRRKLHSALGRPMFQASHR
jgi:hypothetical protein